MSDTCDHDKVYAQRILTSNPPQREWICRKCGAQGRDTMPVIPRDEYLEVMRKWNP